jgi:uncharacterized protein with FMN-binding domain
MKRFLLIAAGTVGGLGAVLSITPPQLGATDLGLNLDAATLTTSETPAQTQTSAPTPTVNSVNGTFTGPVVDVSYGNVQVQINVTNGKITDAQALIAPTGKNDKYTRMSLPALRQQTLAAQSTSIQGVSGASYTTYGWRKSLQGAMVKAGL